MEHKGKRRLIRLRNGNPQPPTKRRKLNHPIRPLEQNIIAQQTLKVNIIARQRTERKLLENQLRIESLRLSNDFKASWAFLKLRHAGLCQPHAKFSDLMRFVNNHTLVLVDWQRFHRAISTWQDACDEENERHLAEQQGMIDGLYESHVNELKFRGLGIKQADRCEPISAWELWRRPAWPEQQLTHVIKIYENMPK